MSSHLLISTMRPMEDLELETYNIDIVSGEDYLLCMKLPLTLPYVYEILGYEKRHFISFLDEFMEYGDAVEVYEYWDGKKVLPESINVPKEARTINLLQLTYKDEYGEYQLNKKNWLNELETRTVVSNRSVTTFSKY
ncbi:MULTISPECIES: hypothetical protein [Oceanobacillus]|uniref:hypothetical protein n=1 Tax=Oceanobacillus TaxID=182709 RepID=UPI000838869C|nr:MULTISPECIES: hypothetical protein [Oceanobacillus]MBU8792469.1 hypothetical protein [Oceanobacillus caeni]